MVEYKRGQGSFSKGGGNNLGGNYVFDSIFVSHFEKIILGAFQHTFTEKMFNS